MTNKWTYSVKKVINILWLWSPSDFIRAFQCLCNAWKPFSETPSSVIITLF